MMELDMAMMEERKYKENEEFGKFNTARDIDEGHILISKTERLAELEKLAMEEIMTKYVNYSTMASEENLIKCRDAVEEIIAKYVNYSTMISKERPAKQPQAKFKTPALIQDDALAYLDLNRKSANGNYAKDAEENAERTDYPNHPSPKVEQVLQPATQPPAEKLSTEAPEVSNKQQNRKNNETKPVATEDKDSITDSSSSGNITSKMLEENLREIHNVDEQLLTNVDEANGEPEVKQVVAEELLDAEDSPKYEPVDVVDTVPDKTVQDLNQDDTLKQQAPQDLTQDEALGHQALQDLTLDEARSNQASQNIIYSGGNHILAAEDQVLAAEDQFLEEEVQHIPPIQQTLVAEDSVLAPQAQRVSPIQQVLVAEDSGLATEVQSIKPAHQVLVAEEHILARTVQHLHPAQQNLVAEKRILVAGKHAQINQQINDAEAIITTSDDLPEEDAATNDDKLCTEYNQEMSRGRVGPRDEDLQHVTDDREGGDRVQLPVGEGYISREKVVAPAHEQHEAQPIQQDLAAEKDQHILPTQQVLIAEDLAVNAEAAAGTDIAYSRGNILAYRGGRAASWPTMGGAISLPQKKKLWPLKLLKKYLLQKTLLRINMLMRRTQFLPTQSESWPMVMTLNIRRHKTWPGRKILAFRHQKKKMLVTMTPQQEVIPTLMMVGVTGLSVMMAVQYSQMKKRILN
jgi:hypothetical protein